MSAVGISFHAESARPPQMIEQSDCCVVQYGRIEDIRLSIFLHTKAEAQALIKAAADAWTVLPETNPLYPSLAEILPGVLAEIENPGGGQPA